MIKLKTKLEVVKADITKLAVDAIVNAANAALAGGGGVDGAIHQAAGPELQAECLKLRGCQTGKAKITKGFKLPATYVIHAVGPVWYGGQRGEAQLLASCYLESLKLAVENDVKTIAFPSISTGAYRFPIEDAAEIAVRATAKFLEENEELEKVIFTCFDDRTVQIYAKIIRKLGINEGN